ANRCAVSLARLPIGFGARSRPAQRRHLNSTPRGKRLIWRSRRFPRRTTSSARFRPARGSSAPNLVQTRLILFAEWSKVIPTPFLVILVLWLVIIFASFSLFSDLNVTVFTCLSLFALSASCAIFLILELSQPFSGLMMISSEPLRHALAPL